MQENNIFYRRENRFSNNVKFVREEYDTFDFNNNLKSDKIESLEFTNYLGSNESNKYNMLLDICKKLYKNFNYLNKIFVPDEIDSERINAKRVYDIMKIVNNKEIDKRLTIFKFKCLKDQEIQFYISKEKQTLKLYLIDIYHIAIEAVNRKTGKADRKKIYEKRKKCNYDIKEIEKQLKTISDKR